MLGTGVLYISQSVVFIRTSDLLIICYVGQVVGDSSKLSIFSDANPQSLFVTEKDAFSLLKNSTVPIFALQPNFQWYNVMFYYSGLGKSCCM